MRHIEPVEDVRMRVWELHLRGIPKTRIAGMVNLDRHTVARLVSECYAETAQERRASLVRKQNAAIARMRRLQEQAWADHDADDERERSVLALMNGGSDDDGKPRSMVRYQSQRSQYLRVILDAEKEIARIEGVYEATDALDGAVVFRVEVSRPDGVAVTSAPNRGMLAGGSADDEQEFETAADGEDEA